MCLPLSMHYELRICATACRFVPILFLFFYLDMITTGKHSPILVSCKSHKASRYWHAVYRALKIDSNRKLAKLSIKLRQRNPSLSEAHRPTKDTQSDLSGLRDYFSLYACQSAKNNHLYENICAKGVSKDWLSPLSSQFISACVND